MAPEAHNADLRVSTHVAEGRSVIVLCGELDIASVGLVGDAFAGIDAGDVQVDATGLTFIDSAGIAALFEARKKLLAHGGTLSVGGAQPSVIRTLTLVGLLDLLGQDLRADADGVGPGPEMNA